MTKTILFTFFLITSPLAQAFEANCKVTRLFNSSLVTESASLESHPEITLDMNLKKITLGTLTYSWDQGDFIEEQTFFGYTKIIDLAPVASSKRFTLNFIEATPGEGKEGELWGHSEFESQKSKIANLVCELKFR